METVEPDEVPEEPEEWSPTRVETVEAETDRPTRPTPPTRPPAMTTTETKRTIDMCKVNTYHLDGSSAGALQNSLYLFRDFLEQDDIPQRAGVTPCSRIRICDWPPMNDARQRRRSSTASRRRTIQDAGHKDSIDVSKGVLCCVCVIFLGCMRHICDDTQLQLVNRKGVIARRMRPYLLSQACAVRAVPQPIGCVWGIPTPPARRDPGDPCIMVRPPGV